MVVFLDDESVTRVSTRTLPSLALGIYSGVSSWLREDVDVSSFTPPELFVMHHHGECFVTLHLLKDKTNRDDFS